MITKVTICNFKCLRKIQVDLERFTVFVGPNSSGKSSFLQGLDALLRAFTQDAHVVENELVQALSRGSKGPVELTYDESDGRSFRYRTPSAPPRRNRSHRNEQWTGDGLGFRRVPTEEWSQWNPESSDSLP